MRATALELQALNPGLFISFQRPNGISVQIHAYDGDLWVSDGGAFAHGVALAGQPLLQRDSIEAICARFGTMWWDPDTDAARIGRKLALTESCSAGIERVGGAFDALLEAQRAFAGVRP